MRLDGKYSVMIVINYYQLPWWVPSKFIVVATMPGLGVRKDWMGGRTKKSATKTGKVIGFIGLRLIPIFILNVVLSFDSLQVKFYCDRRQIRSPNMGLGGRR